LPEATDKGEALVTLEMMIAQLPGGLKEPLILSTLEGQSHKKTSLILTLTPKAIEARIARVKKLLLKLWLNASSL
jgi:DNA-directed RNA polymerase specialized sigma24 family protein